MYTIRPIQASDNEIMAAIIQDVLTEFKANLPGTAYYDPAIHQLHAYYQQTGAAYFVAEIEGQVVGGGGIGPLTGATAGVCELQKLYLSAAGRGIGLGKALMQQCLQFARDAGYQQCYLESLPQLSKGVALYEKTGFRYLDKPMGETGHCGCNLWMIKEL